MYIIGDDVLCVHVICGDVVLIDLLWICGDDVICGDDCGNKLWRRVWSVICDINGDL